MNNAITIATRMASIFSRSTPFFGYSLPVSGSEEHTSELQSRGLNSYAVFCLKKKRKKNKKDATVGSMFIILRDKQAKTTNNKNFS